MDIEEAIKNKQLLPYRQGVIGLILNKQGEVLIAQLSSYKDNQWRFPGGGIDEGEEPSKALLRELYEELGSEQFEIVAESKYKAKFDWPEEAIRRRYEKSGELKRGQEQAHFLVNFKGDHDDFHLDPNEIRMIKWIALDQLPKYFIFPGQWEITEKVIKELIK